MEFDYDTTVHHKGCLFYVSKSGNKVYFVCGGCIFAASRPTTGDGTSVGEMMKFGLTLVGSDGRGRCPDLPDYVDSELRRRGMRRAAPGVHGHVFLDSVDMMTHDPSCSERDLCGHTDIAVTDPFIAQRLVSLEVSSGLIVTAVTDSPKDRKLRLLEIPIVANAYSGFVYEVNPCAFAMVQARISDPPAALCELTEKLFDGIPGGRAALKDNDVPDRVDVIITSTSSARTGAAKGSMGRRGPGGQHAGTRRFDKSGAGGRTAKTTKICEYVQVKYIAPVLDIWIPQTHHAVPVGRQTVRKSLAALWSAFCRVTYVLDPSNEPPVDLTDELCEARGKMIEAADAIFGKSSPPFLPPGNKRDYTVPQKFLVFQYVQHSQGMPSCYGYLRDLCEAVGEALDSDPPMERDAIADAVTEIFRACAFMGAAAQIVASADHRSEQFLEPRVSAAPTTDACMDADFLISVLEEASDDLYVCAERDARVVKLAVVLDAIYSGEGAVSTAARESRSVGNAELLCVAIDITGSCAFDPPKRLGGLFIYSSALQDLRLKDANLPSFYE